MDIADRQIQTDFKDFLGSGNDISIISAGIGKKRLLKKGACCVWDWLIIIPPYNKADNAKKGTFVTRKQPFTMKRPPF